MNSYLAKQFSGKYIQATINGIQQSFDACKNLTDYFENLSLDTAGEKELENIGLLIGYPRPVIPNGFNRRLFTFGASSSAPQYSVEHGFGSVHTTNGGFFDSIHAVNTALLPLNYYREVLKRIAYIKYYGISIFTIDLIANLAGKPYTISYNAYQDIVVTYSEEVYTEYIWLYNSVFEAFTTMPQVLIKNT